MTANQKRVGAFAVGMALSAFIAWLGGYDFATRNIDVAFGFSCAVLFSALLAGHPSIGGDK